MKEYKVKVYSDSTEWYQNGQLHREDGPAIEWHDGDKFWYRNDQLHREDGPAYEGAHGDKHWFLNGQRHRDDGPAVECSNGDKSWWLNNQCLSEEEFNRRTQTTELTLDQIAEKFGIDVSKLKIKKT